MVSQDLWEHLLVVLPAASDPVVSLPTWDAQLACLPVVPDQVALLLTAALETSLETTLFRDSSERTALAHLLCNEERRLAPGQCRCERGNKFYAKHCYLKSVKV